MNSLVIEQGRFFSTVQPNIADTGDFNCLHDMLKIKLIDMLSFPHIVRLAQTCRSWNSLVGKRLHQRYLPKPATIAVIAQRFLDELDLSSAMFFAERFPQKVPGSLGSFQQAINQKAWLTADLAIILRCITNDATGLGKLDLQRIVLQLTEPNKLSIFAQWLSGLTMSETSKARWFIFSLCNTLPAHSKILAEALFNLVLKKDPNLLNKLCTPEDPALFVLDYCTVRITTGLDNFKTIVKTLSQHGLEDLAAHIIAQATAVISKEDLSYWICTNSSAIPLALFKVASHLSLAQYDNVVDKLLARFKPEKLVEPQQMRHLEDWVRQDGPYLNCQQKARGVAHVATYFELNQLEGVEELKGLLLKLEKSFIKPEGLVRATRELPVVPRDIGVKKPERGMEVERNSNLWRKADVLVRQGLYEEARLAVIEDMAKYEGKINSFWEALSANRVEALVREGLYEEVHLAVLENIANYECNTSFFWEKLSANINEAEAEAKSLAKEAVELQQKKICQNYAELNRANSWGGDEDWALSESDLLSEEEEEVSEEVGEDEEELTLSLNPDLDHAVDLD